MSKRRRASPADNSDDAYELFDDSLWDFPQISPRPFPASHALASQTSLASTGIANNSKQPELLSPLMRSFFVALGKDPDAVVSRKQHNPGDEGAQKQQGSTSDDNQSSTIKIDDPSQAKLTKGQHNRYLALLSVSRGEWNKKQRGEFSTLHTQVQEEQQRYREALLEFWETQKDRLLMGFSSQLSTTAAAAFAQLGASVPDNWSNEWSGKAYGSVRQIISIEQLHNNSTHRQRWTVDALSSEIIHPKVSWSEDPNGSYFLDTASLPKEGSVIPLPDSEQQYAPVEWVHSDNLGLDLAKQHKSMILTDIDTMEALLQLENARWMIPVTFREGIACLDLPLPTRDLSPRQCLTRGFQRGLDQMYWSSSSNGDSQKTLQPSTYGYTLLTLPATAGHRTSTTVMVRSRIGHHPHRLHAHLEYFPERGEELPSTDERSLWVLDHLLHTQAVVARVDPTSSRLLECRIASVAHALTGNEIGASSATHNSDSMNNWHHLAQILNSVPSIGKSGSSVLCFPGRGGSAPATSVTVHHERRGDLQPEINFAMELKDAGKVYLNQAAMRRCMRDWKWTAKRAPYTFPLETTQE